MSQDAGEGGAGEKAGERGVEEVGGVWGLERRGRVVRFGRERGGVQGEVGEERRDGVFSDGCKTREVSLNLCPLERITHVTHRRR